MNVQGWFGERTLLVREAFSNRQGWFGERTLLVRSLRLVVICVVLSFAGRMVRADEKDLESPKDDFWVEISAFMPPPKPLALQASSPSEYSSIGKWSDVIEWPHVAVSAANLPDGRILTFASNEKRTFPAGDEMTYATIWDPATGVFTEVNHTSHDLFCAGLSMLEDGRVFVPGGRNTVKRTSTFDFRTGSWKRIEGMVGSRWYPTVTTLGDGKVIAASGSGTGENTVEKWTQGLGWARLNGIDWSAIAGHPEFFESNWWPYNFLGPDGRVFHAGPTETMHWLDLSGNGSLTAAGNVPGTHYHKHGAAVMYDEGKLIVFGGASSASGGASWKAFTVDLNGVGPVAMLTGDMNHQRRFVNGVVLPNGEVMAIGGNNSGMKFQDLGSVHEAEIWNPESGTWRRVANMVTPRNYHSVALLMPNGKVLAAGGGLSGGPTDHLDGEVYTPPNLFAPNGAEAVRPVISNAPEAAGYGMEITVEATPGMEKFSLVRMMAVTHGLATDCRFLPMEDFTENSPGVYVMTTHANPNVLTPGYWMLFGLDENGVHSEAAIIQFSANATPVVGGDITLEGTSPGAVESGNEVAFSMESVGGVNPEFTWDFGDGSAPVTTSQASVEHTFSAPGRYSISVTARNADGSGAPVTHTFSQIVHGALTAERPRHSSSIVFSEGRVWNVNPDNDTVSVFDATTFQKLAEVAVGRGPVSIAPDGQGRMWVVNKRDSSLTAIMENPQGALGTTTLPYGSKPHGLIVNAEGTHIWVACEGSGRLLKIRLLDMGIEASLDLGKDIRHVSISGDESTLLVSRFISPPLPMEHTANPLTQMGPQKFGGEVLVVDADSMTKLKTVVLAHSDLVDASDAGRGIPNYLGAAAISPDGSSAWVPSKQDNVLRGELRNGRNLNHENTIRSVASRIDMAGIEEVAGDRIDFDNAGMATSATFGPNGAFVFMTLAGSGDVTVVDAYSGDEIFRFPTGAVPRGVAVSPDGDRLFVHNFLDRTVAVFDCSGLIHQAVEEMPELTVMPAVASEKLSSQVLAGKKLFHDTKDNRIALHEYISCASCHDEGGHDGRVWDFTGFGEGLRNTISLRGRAGTGHGPVHWTANFDEIHDFEGQMRSLPRGIGLLTNAQFSATEDPLGEPKAGLSADLDALAAYVESLDEFEPSPHRVAAGVLSPEAEAGRDLFAVKNCAECHGGSRFTDSAVGVAHDIGSIKPSSGTRLNSPLSALDTPTLRDVWDTAPYLHDGSAETLEASIAAHTAIETTATERTSLAAYLREIDGSEPAAPEAAGQTFDSWQTSTSGAGSGPNANGDGDQYTDLMEYALGLDPASGVTQANAFSVSPTSATVTRPADRVGVETILEVSGDLKNWTALGSPAITQNSDGTETLDFAGLKNVAGLNEARGFARLRVNGDGGATAISPVQGWVKHNIRPGHESFGITLVKPAIFSGTLTGASGSTLSIAENIELNRSTYVEIAEGEFEGHRFEIDFQNSSGNQLQIDFSSRNTTLDSLPGGLSGARVIVRPHQTLGGIFKNDQFFGGTKASEADRVLFYGPGGYESYFLLKYGDRFDHWVKAGDSSLADQTELPVYPGEGGFFIRRGAATAVVITGEVRKNDFIQPLRIGYNLLAEPTPVTRTANDRGLALASGFQGGTKASNSDQFTVWKGDLSPGDEGYEIFYLLNFRQFQYWTKSGDSSIPDVGEQPFFDFRRARFLWRTSNELPDYRVGAGW